MYLLSKRDEFVTRDIFTRQIEYSRVREKKLPARNFEKNFPKAVKIIDTAELLTILKKRRKKNVLPLLESLSRESIRNYRIVYRIRPREFIHAQDLFIPFRKEVNVTTVLLFPPRLMKLERKNGDAVSRRFHVGFQLDIYIYISKET